MAKREDPEITRPATARLACGCTVAFREGTEGSPVTVVLQTKAETCTLAIHVGGMPLFDRREALRPATRPTAPPQQDFEEES